MVHWIDHFRQPLPNHFDLPHRLHRLADIAYNLWWTWHPEAERVFKFIDPEIWETTYHNPVCFLRLMSKHKFKRVLLDRTYLGSYDRVIEAFDAYMDGAQNTWYQRQYGGRGPHTIAYFSTEFGLHESLPFYAGGLGVLSGDHLKEASDLGLPMVAIGFLYTQGYFKQHITEDGWQEARYANLSFSDLPALPVLDDEGSPITIGIQLPGRDVHAQLWLIQVGRVPLYLLDTNVPSNTAADRNLSARLYTSDLELRISQEYLLGIGGVRALRALGYDPAIWHINEGHSSFLALERARELVASGLDFHQARQQIRASTIFTTHTPVPAGHDEFPLWLIDKYFNSFWPALGLNRQDFIQLALQNHSWGDAFSMTVLALHMAQRSNGVSKLHGQVAREMWSFLWKTSEPEEVPIQHITNGIHTGTWMARRLKNLLDKYFDPDWLEHLDDPEIWEAIRRVPDIEMWEVHKHLKRKLVAYMRERVRRQWIPGDHHPVQVVASGVLLDPYALTIGFARRFATYKRANLILHDPERLLEIINRPSTPVQIIFAGKAHPADEPGKRLIQEIYRHVKRAEAAGRLVFLEDYDINIARYLVQGVDVWLNTPRRLNEASGTSGQKAALNGVLNASILDGWWSEGYNGRNGWAIGDGQPIANQEKQDEADAESLYQVLESEIIPLYYLERSGDGLPGEWLGWMKESIRSLAPTFTMRRVLKEYIHSMYQPAYGEPIAL